MIGKFSFLFSCWVISLFLFGIDGVASQSKQSQSVVFKNFVVSQDKQQITKVRDYPYNSAVPITATNCNGKTNLKSTIKIPINNVKLAHTLTWEDSILKGIVFAPTFEEGNTNFRNVNFISRTASTANGQETYSMFIQSGVETMAGYKDSFGLTGAINEIKMPYTTDFVLTYTNGSTATGSTTGFYTKERLDLVLNTKKSVHCAPLPTTTPTTTKPTKKSG